MSAIVFIMICSVNNMSVNTIVLLCKNSCYPPNNHPPPPPRSSVITVLASTTGPFLPPPPPPYTPFTINSNLLFTPPLLFTPIYYLPPFTVYRHLLFTIIYYLTPLLLYPFYYFSGIKTHRKSFRRFIFSWKHSHLMSKMTGIRNSYVEIFKKFA